MKKLLLISLLILTGFAAYAAEETKDESFQVETIISDRLPEDIQNRIISFMSETPLQKLQKLNDADLINISPKLARTLTDHEDVITSIAYSPDGLQLASGSWDKTIKIWDTATGDCLYTFLTGHTDWVTIIAYNSDGSQLASGSRDTTVKIWNVVPNFALSTQQNALLFKITQTALAWQNQGTCKRLQFNKPEDIETYATFPEELQEILKPVVAYSPTNSHSNKTEHGTAHATSASASSKK